MTTIPTGIEFQFHQWLSEQGFSDEEIGQLLAAAALLELPTRHILLNQGETPTHGYFVGQGICHASYLTEQGKELSKAFYWDEDWIIGLDSLIQPGPSPYLLESLTPVTLLCLPMTQLHHWRRHCDPLYLKLLEHLLMQQEHQQRFRLLVQPEQRYQLLCQQFPEWMAMLSDHHIAAYLDIPPENLSRFKARLSKG